MSTDSKYDVFISHSSKDNLLAELLYAFMKEKGLSVWMDTYDIRPGKPYAKEIMDGLSRSASMLLIYSVNACGSKDMKREVANADKRNIPIVVFKIDQTPLVDVFEYYLALDQWIVADTDPTGSFNTILATLRKHLDKDAEPKRERPLEDFTCKVTFKHVLVKDTNFYLLKGIMDGVEVRLLGRLANVRVGSVISATGYWTDDKKYGREFRVVSWRYVKDPEPQGESEQQGSRRPQGKKSGLSAMIRIVRNELKKL